MRTTTGIGCLILGAAVGLAGCTADSVQGLQKTNLEGVLALQTQSGGERVIGGSVDAVAQSTHRSLTQLGLAAEMTQKGEAIYISSKTSTGDKFALVLTRDKSSPAQQTNVKLEWEGNKNDQLSGLILGQIALVAGR